MEDVYWVLINKATETKTHLPTPFIGEMLEWIAKHSFFCYFDGYSGYNQIPSHPDNQSKTTFTWPYLLDLATHLVHSNGIWRYSLTYWNVPGWFLSPQSIPTALRSWTKFSSGAKRFTYTLVGTNDIELLDIVLTYRVFGRGIQVNRGNRAISIPMNVKGVRSFIGHVVFLFVIHWGYLTEFSLAIRKRIAQAIDLGGGVEPIAW